MSNCLQVVHTNNFWVGYVFVYHVFALHVEVSTNVLCTVISFMSVTSVTSCHVCHPSASHMLLCHVGLWYSVGLCVIFVFFAVISVLSHFCWILSCLCHISLLQCCAPSVTNPCQLFFLFSLSCCVIVSVTHLCHMTVFRPNFPTWNFYNFTWNPIEIIIYAWSWLDVDDGCEHDWWWLVDHDYDWWLMKPDRLSWLINSHD